MKNILIIIFFFHSMIIQAQDGNSPREIDLVFGYLVNVENPEYFGQDHFQPRPISWQILDIDSDGITEVFLQTFPHFRQSPTISVFQILPNDSVQRIIEGLAPGHLIPISADDDYFDTHTTGKAIDMQLGDDDYEKARIFAESSLQWGMSVVLYKNFIHADQREGEGIFIDLMYLDDYIDESTCENFQFSMPEQIIAGSINGKSSNFFIAKVGTELFCYEITGFDGTRYINKAVSIMEIPRNFKQLVNAGGVIKYENQKGQLLDLEIKHGVKH